MADRDFYEILGLSKNASDSEIKKSSLAQLGISGTAVGSSNEIQYNNSNQFAGASNVEIKNNTLALKEQATPSAVSGYGMVYAKTDNELYYRNDTNSEVQITSGGAIAGGGAFRGVKANLSANNGISNNSATTPTAWSEVYDVGTFHDGSTNPERFTFGGTGYFLISIQQEWEADSAGGTAGLCQPVERDIFDCHLSCFWPAHVPDQLNHSPDWTSKCASAQKDWRKVDLIFP